MERPSAQGLYDSSFERDACGIGFVAQLDATASHKIVQDALHVLFRLDHRGGQGCDPETGDGAGILMQLPHRFFRDVMADEGVTLPDGGRFGSGLVFLPPDSDERSECIALCEQVTAAHQARVLGWRKVPVDQEALSNDARACEPVILQIFIEGHSSWDETEFERKLYVIRKSVEHAVRGAETTHSGIFDIPSLSLRTIVYKGLLRPEQISRYYTDLAQPEFKSCFALVHQRFSTNTLPSWDLAQPFRCLAHNGEINTLCGNRNWMHAREALLQSPLFGNDLKEILPIIPPGLNDSATLDVVFELLLQGGRRLPHVMAMLIPEAWEKHETMDPGRRAFYEYHASLMEPWDGPASVICTDGRFIGAALDRSGLRPSRYTVTKEGLVVLSSETGVLSIPAAEIAQQGSLEPGKNLVLDLDAGRIVPDDEIKSELAARQPYRSWLSKNQRSIEQIPAATVDAPLGDERCERRQKIFRYTEEENRMVLQPMAETGLEPIGSMGADTPLAVLSRMRPLLFNYFKQLFAQVTNPPLDAIREELVTSTRMLLGSKPNLLSESEEHCRTICLEQPILDDDEFWRITALDQEKDYRSVILQAVFNAPRLSTNPCCGDELSRGLAELRREAEHAVREGCSLIILSDRSIDMNTAAIPSLLACSAVHHHLIRKGLRMRCSIIVESAEVRETHHFALLFGYGASAIYPYHALATVRDLCARGQLSEGITPEQAGRNYLKAALKGVIKVMSKIGISTLQSYCGAQIFEAVGIGKHFIDKYFTGTTSRIGGIGFREIAEDTVWRHRRGFPYAEDLANDEIDLGGEYQWRRGGEQHLNEPIGLSALQHAVRNNCSKSYQTYADSINQQSEDPVTLRGILELSQNRTPVPIEEVEPAHQIVRRFKTGAMSFGAISFEAHSNLAIAMNRIGGMSNSGEGGEDSARYETINNDDAKQSSLHQISSWVRDAAKNGDSARSAIKQVASGRFGVTSEYLVNADEIQIKVAQGAKPGEGGQLPGHKVDKWIATVRHSTPGVGLISPPPHHDIYSIEDLAQLIYDLKCSNPEARISVKLVSAAGVGTVAAGVAKAKADLVLISGADGGTGASPLSSIKHAGLPWELGLAETHQVLVQNDLRSRIRVEVDGQMKTGRDVAIACLLGAEEFGFSTAPLIASGCIMMRKCHLNTCPVGVATQDPELRQKFPGKPEHVVNFMFFVAEEFRAIMASLGFRKVTDMVGRTECLGRNASSTSGRAANLKLENILAKPTRGNEVDTYCTTEQDHELQKSLDMRTLLELAQPALKNGDAVKATVPICNTDRAVGTITGSALTRKYGKTGLPDGTIQFTFTGSAGQSFGAFVPKGMTLQLIGDANDYFGKGLSGGNLVVYGPDDAGYDPEKSPLIGNVALYGATNGTAFIAGIAGQRFCVRNSGVHTVVEGVGDHGCEYMTGGRVVVLGDTGRNFAAGMSGGIAYVLDPEGQLAQHNCNQAMVDLEPLQSLAGCEEELRGLIEQHSKATQSSIATRILADWDTWSTQFVTVIPREFRRVFESPPTVDRVVNAA